MTDMRQISACLSEHVCPISNSLTSTSVRNTISSRSISFSSQCWSVYACVYKCPLAPTLYRPCHITPIDEFRLHTHDGWLQRGKHMQIFTSLTFISLCVWIFWQARRRGCDLAAHELVRVSTVQPRRQNCGHYQCRFALLLICILSWKCQVCSVRLWTAVDLQRHINTEPEAPISIQGRWHVITTLLYEDFWLFVTLSSKAMSKFGVLFSVSASMVWAVYSQFLYIIIISATK